MTELITETTSEGYLGQLTDEVIELYEATDDTITTIVTALLAFQQQSPAITVGTIEPVVTRSIKVENDTILSALFHLRDTYGGYIEVDSTLALNWWNTIGEDKGQQIRYRKNLKGIRRRRDYRGTCQKVFAYGSGEGDSRIQLDSLLVLKETAVESSDVTYGYLSLGGLYSCYKGWTAAGGALPAEMIVYEDDVDVSGDWVQGADEQTLRCAIADYNPASVYTVTYRHATYLWDGTINPLVRTQTDRRTTHPDTLIAWARLYLTGCKDPITTYEVDIIDLSALQRDAYFVFEDLHLGSIVTVIDEDLGIDVSTIVVRLTNRDLQHPEDLVVELCTSTKDLADFLSGIYDGDQLSHHVAVTVGAGQVIVKGVFTVMDWVTAGETTICGDNIRTGVLESTNWGAGAGSQFNLNDGTFKLGGSAAPKLSWDGATLAVTGYILIGDAIAIGGAAADINAHTTTISGSKITTNTIVANALTTSTLTSRTITLGSGGKFVTGASGTNRFEITNTIIAGISSANVTQFEVRASDGKAYFGGGTIVCDATGFTFNDAPGKKITLKATGLNDATIDLVSPGGGIRLYCLDGIYLSGNMKSSLVPATDLGSDLGETATPKRWGYGHFKYLGDTILPIERMYVNEIRGYGTSYCGHESYPFTKIMGDMLGMKERAGVPATIAGCAQLYAKSDNKIYALDGDGFVHEMAYV